MSLILNILAYLGAALVGVLGGIAVGVLWGIAAEALMNKRRRRKPVIPKPIEDMTPKEIDNIRLVAKRAALHRAVDRGLFDDNIEHSGENDGG